MDKAEASKMKVQGTQRSSQQDMASWWPLLRQLSWCPIYESSHCNSFEDLVTVDEIFTAIHLKTRALIQYKDVILPV